MIFLNNKPGMLPDCSQSWKVAPDVEVGPVWMRWNSPDGRSTLKVTFETTGPHDWVVPQIKPVATGGTDG